MHANHLILKHIIGKDSSEIMSSNFIVISLNNKNGYHTVL
jgi:hypothetical protein